MRRNEGIFLHSPHPALYVFEYMQNISPGRHTLKFGSGKDGIYFYLFILIN